MIEDPLAVARLLADEFEADGLPYAIGGALALAYCGVPRGTHDVDVNVFVDPDRFDEVAHVLARAGVAFDPDKARKAAEEGAVIRGLFGEMYVDVFLNSIPLHESAATRTQIRPLQSRPARILSAEDLATFKMLFHRGKDRTDVERMVAIGRGVFDVEYVRRWLVDTAGEDNYRVAEWDEIVRDLG